MDKQHMLETYQAWQATYINLVGHSARNDTAIDSASSLQFLPTRNLVLINGSGSIV
ncbi:hypothetical protein JHK86_009792 [Glycine max]|nr:hypothetical protein JHK86_009792 [Glycine max]